MNVGLRHFITKPVGARHKNKVNYVGTRQTKITYKKEGSEKTISSDTYATGVTPIKKHEKFSIRNKYLLIKKPIGRRQSETFKVGIRQYAAIKYTSAIFRINSNIFKTFIYATHYFNFRVTNYSTGSSKMGERLDVTIMRMDLCSSEEEHMRGDSTNKENTPITEQPSIKENPPIRGKNNEREFPETGGKSKKSLFTPILDKEDWIKRRNSREEEEEGSANKEWTISQDMDQEQE